MHVPCHNFNWKPQGSVGVGFGEELAPNYIYKRCSRASLRAICMWQATGRSLLYKPAQEVGLRHTVMSVKRHHEDRNQTLSWRASPSDRRGGLLGRAPVILAGSRQKWTKIVHLQPTRVASASVN